MPDTHDKGKGRATETTPLLEASSSTSPNGFREQPPRPRRLGLRVFFISLAVSIVFLAIIFALLASSYAAHARRLSPQDLRSALYLDGPYNVAILNSTENNLLLQLSFRAGIDAGSVIGTYSNPEGIFERLSSAVGQWAIHWVDSISLELSTVQLASNSPDSAVLGAFLLQPFTLPLAANPSNSDWLHSINTPIAVSPTSNRSALTSFLRDAWKDGEISLALAISCIHIGGASGWQRNLHTSLSNISSDLRMLVPSLPGLPPPGTGKSLPPISELITLQQFELQTAADQLNLHARASVINPVPPSIHLTIPELPFIVGIPAAESDSVAIATVQTAPIRSTHPNITFDLSGQILPLSPTASIPLSTFLSKYLSGQPNLISISSPLYPALSVTPVFPAPHPRPQILQNVTIHNMKIKPGNTFHASGTVIARIVLPTGMKVDLDAKRVLPDVLIIDGELDDEPFGGQSTRLPDPLPERAFGHIQPDDWVDAVCTPEPDHGEGSSSFTISAKIVDVPLDVLPGREKEFSNFVSKVIFSTDGAVAGILGTTAVDVLVYGLHVDGHAEARVVLPSLPFHGSVRIHKT